MLQLGLFPKNLQRYLSSIPPESARAVGASGLALLVSAVALSLVPVSQTPLLITTVVKVIEALGLNVTATLLEKGFQHLRTQPTDDEVERLIRLAAFITRDIQYDAKLRRELGIFLDDNLDAFQIAMEVAKGNPALHGWLLVKIYKEITQPQNRADFSHKTVAKIKEEVGEITSSLTQLLQGVSQYGAELNETVTQFQAAFSQIHETIFELKELNRQLQPGLSTIKGPSTSPLQKENVIDTSVQFVEGTTEGKTANKVVVMPRIAPDTDKLGGATHDKIVSNIWISGKEQVDPDFNKLGGASDDKIAPNTWISGKEQVDPDFDKLGGASDIENKLSQS